MSRQNSAEAVKSEVIPDGLGALLFAMLLSLAAAEVDAASAPQQWIDQSEQGVAKHLHPVIEEHIKSQLDRRSYRLHRTTMPRPHAASTGCFEAWEPSSVSEVSSESVAGESWLNRFFACSPLKMMTQAMLC